MYTVVVVGLVHFRRHVMFDDFQLFVTYSELPIRFTFDLSIPLSTPLLIHSVACVWAHSMIMSPQCYLDTNMALVFGGRRMTTAQMSRDEMISRIKIIRQSRCWVIFIQSICSQAHIFYFTNKYVFFRSAFSVRGVTKSDWPLRANTTYKHFPLRRTSNHRRFTAYTHSVHGIGTTEWRQSNICDTIDVG
jgi:hypothetical protein